MIKFENGQLDCQKQGVYLEEGDLIIYGNSVCKIMKISNGLPSETNPSAIWLGMIQAGGNSFRVGADRLLEGNFIKVSLSSLKEWSEEEEILRRK